MNESERIERRLKLHDMRVFMAVVEAGSMGKAAERLRTSQPAISRSIADLEHTLGVRLLDRSPRGIEPTTYGRALIRRGLAVFDELHQSIKDIEFLADPAAGELRIGASIAVAVGFASAVIDRLNRDYPRLAFQMLSADTGTVIRALEERKVDLVVAHIIEPIAEEHISTEVLFHEAHIVAAGRKSRWTRQRRLDLAQLMDERWVLPPPDSQFGRLVLEAFRAKGLALPRAVLTASLPVRNALAATGRYLTMLPRVALAFPPNASPLKALPIDLPTTRRPLAIIALKNRMLNPAAEVFAECARKTAKALQ